MDHGKSACSQFRPSLQIRTDKGSRLRLVGILRQVRGVCERGSEPQGGVLLARASPVVQMTSYLPAQTCSSRAPYRVLSTLYLHKGHAGLLDLPAHELRQACKAVCVRVCLCADAARLRMRVRRGCYSLAQTRHDFLLLPSLLNRRRLRPDSILSSGNKSLQLHARIGLQCSKIQSGLLWVPSI